jgi:CheY-like chemotaxis protein
MKPGERIVDTDSVSAPPGVGSAGAGPERVLPGSPLVLIVDDDQNSREGVAEFLLAAGYRVSEAADGPEALAKALRRRPDVVLLDLAIPKLDGWTVARTLKADPGLKSVPVVAFSAFDYPNERKRAEVAGCDAFLAKPCDPAKLVETVRRLTRVL